MKELLFPLNSSFKTLFSGKEPFYIAKFHIFLQKITFLIQTELPERQKAGLPTIISLILHLSGIYNLLVEAYKL